MVEQCAALQHSDAHRSRLLPLLLVLGGGLAIWWTLMTGTAQAAEAAQAAPSPIDPVAHTVSNLAQPVTSRLGHVEHATRAVTHAVTHRVTHGATTELRRASGSVPRVPAVASVPTAHEAATAPEVAPPARHHRASRTHPRTSSASAPDAGVATTGVTTAGVAAHPTQGSHRDHRAQGSPAAQRHTGGPVSPAPSDSSGTGGASGSGPGPVSGALDERAPPSELLASSEHSAEPAPDLPADPAYPPGCSPD